MNCNKIWRAKFFLLIVVFTYVSWAQEHSKRIISGRVSGIGFQLGSLQSYIVFRSKYTAYEGTSFYNMSGLWLRIKPFPAIFLAINRESEIENSKRFYLYVPIIIKQKLLIELESAYLKGFRIRDLDTDLEFELTNFNSTRILGSLVFFFSPNKFSWKHAFSFGERQIKSGGTWAVGTDIGLYSFNTGSDIPLILNDANLIYLRQLSMLFVDAFFGGYYNWIIKAWQRRGKTRILGTGGSIMLGVSMQAGQITIGNSSNSAGRIEMFGFLHATFHMLYTTDRWVFRVYTFTRKHTISPKKLLTIENRWNNAAFQVIYLFGI